MRTLIFVVAVVQMDTPTSSAQGSAYVRQVTLKLVKQWAASVNNRCDSVAGTSYFSRILSKCAPVSARASSLRTR